VRSAAAHWAITPGEYCWSSGPIWDFRNASGLKYYVDEVIGEITVRALPGR
jgi:hypothetical protein